MAFKSDEVRRAYFREYNKVWYQQHKERLLEKRRQHKKMLKQWLNQYKSKLRCIECGETHPACLQFHHKERAEKKISLGDMANRASSIRVLMEEIKKCEVLCVNCHAKHHWRENHATDNWEEILPLEE
jgi:hypothetical protein